MPPQTIDDPPILGVDRLYRRIPPPQAPFNKNRNRRWPSSAALLPSQDDENEVSVYLGSVLEEYKLNPMEVLEGHEDYGLICFPVSSAQAAGYGIRRDPVLNSKRPLRVDPAHAVLTGTPLTSKQKRKPARLLLDDDQLIIMRDPVGFG
jgi:hypothetical protein